MIIKYPEDIYPKEVLVKAAYHFLDKVYIHIDKEGTNYIVNIKEKSSNSTISADDFDNEMIAQSARYIISQRTKNIREITLGRALASTIIENPSINNEADNFDNIEEILKDWFEDEQ
ncbi:His-Xaa-Ser system protein HxsD [Butyrivibrio sp. MC2013]|uniref:His-Xaa-Ser system protein HxsD n=1 Tax=Butyrivibrio sp. MC2013 TaxID=1280686 RepID=UPI0003F8E667|nr:His-Xaa-Ser system protein HxsD [Butyrivibrio sp. MC2013]